MRSHRSPLSVLLIAGVLLAPGLRAASYDGSDPYYRQRSPNQTGDFQYDDSKDVPWREGSTQVPPPPGEDAPLGQLKLDSLQKAFTAHLDTSTLGLSPVDGMLRYWLVVRSGGSATISYEGMNCRTREYKIYAFADPREPDGLRMVREPRWQLLGMTRRSDYRWELADSYLCIGTNAKTPADVIGTIGGYYQRQNPFSEYTDNTRPQIP